MGSNVKAICKCGINKNLLIGGGIKNLNKVFIFPCFCDFCSDIVQSNLLNSVPICPKCKKEGVIPYDDGSLIYQRGTNIVSICEKSEGLGREPQLTDGAYFCPKCKKKNLRFEPGYLVWD